MREAEAPARTPDRDDLPPWQAVGGSPDLGTSYWEQLTNAPQRRDNMQRPVKATPYGGGLHAPTLEQLDLDRQSKIRQYYGIDPHLEEEEVKGLADKGWVYGQAAPQGYHYNDDGLLEKNVSKWKTVGRIAAIAAPIAATVATGGAASPWLVAAIGAGAGAANGALNGGGWRGALTGAAIGGVGGYAGAGGFGGAAGSTGASAAQATGSQIARDAVVKAGIGAAQSAANGGGVKGALLGAGAGAAGAGVAGATAAAPLAARVAAQAGTNAAFGAARGGVPGALQGAAAGAAGAAGGTKMPTTDGGIDWTNVLINTALPVAANVAGSMAAGREAGRSQQNANTITRDTQTANNAANFEKAIEARAALEMAQKQDARAAMNDAYKNALRSSLLQNIKDASFNRPKGVPTIAMGGGLRPSALGPGAQQAAQLMEQRALNALMSGEKYADLPAVEKTGLSPLARPSGVDTALGLAGSVGKALTAVQNQRAQDAQTSLVQKLLQQSQQAASQGVARPASAPAQQAPAFGSVLPNPTLPGDEYDWAE